MMFRTVSGFAVLVAGILATGCASDGEAICQTLSDRDTDCDNDIGIFPIFGDGGCSEWSEFAEKQCDETELEQCRACLEENTPECSNCNEMCACLS